ncbi:DUF1559 domain-containing protein [Geminisphaera colitermitum]|uniref:DUF1559 family PulG-like putative transporter n=1 Tax=Geminisphaera colitermitum TaxID=1148786 RepID=UPI0001965581|nr:DUF1559 domain-containing protein [Geminisphaera colitermitum]
MKTAFSSDSSRVREHSGFTLIELLTVIAIIGILAAIIIPTVGRVRESARAAQCLSNLRQIGMAITACAYDEKMRYPFGLDNRNNADIRWHNFIYAYLAIPKGSSDKTRSIPLLFCQQEKTKAVDTGKGSNYIANPHLMPEQKNDNPSARRPMSAVQRPSQVILVADGAVSQITSMLGRTRWGFTKQEGWDKEGAEKAETISPNTEKNGDPTDNDFNYRLSWRHNGKTQAVFADGHAAALAEGQLRYKHFRTDY